ncbi:MAG: extracellular solute-binding protein, partial [Alphaproteobacteria bacterium]
MIAPARAIMIAAFAAVLAAPALAEPKHGVAMHGEPKYGPGFTHLDYVNPDAPKGGELRRAIPGTFDSLNSFIIKGVPAAGRQYVFESLLKRVWDEPFTLYGLIAESVEMPDDRSWVAFTLRPEARFHDGSPITVDDVIFSMETLREEGRPNHRLFYSKVARIERPGERTVKFIFREEEKDREAPLLMGLMPILSKKYFTENEFNRTTLDPPLGSGPYRVMKVDPGRAIVYERFENYWGRDLPINRGQNNFQRIRYDYFRDGNVLMEAFKAGEYDLRSEPSAERWATNYNFPAVSDGRVKLETLPHSRATGMLGFVFNTRRDIFEDVRVRQAIGQLFDFEWTNKNLLHGAYSRTTSYFDNSELSSRGLPGAEELALLEPFRGQIPESVFNAEFKAPVTDGSGNIRPNLRRASALLKDAGWEVRDRKMTRASDGRPLAFEILLDSPTNEKIALTFARNLERLGIDANVRTVDSAQYIFLRRTYDYDMIINRWGVSLSPGNEQAFYWGSEAADQEGTRNYMGVKSAAVDALIKRITAAPNREGLVTAIRALDRVLLAGHYIVPLYHLSEDRVAYWDRLGRPDVTPIYGRVFETWWEDPVKAAA